MSTIDTTGSLAANSGNKHNENAMRWSLALALYVLAFVIAWVTVSLIMDAEPHSDNIEQLNWAKHIAWGYDKHPPLPTMILWVFEQVFPPSVLLTCALGGLQVAIVLMLTWAITRHTLDNHRAVIAVLFVSCVTYYTNRLHLYNHNTGLLVAYAVCVYCVFKAAQTGALWWYALLGISWAVGLLSKYQMVISIACNLIFLAWVNRFQVRKLFVPLLVATLFCAIAIAPHLVWLVEHHFPSFHYAAKYVSAHLPWWQRPDDIASFLADQALRVIPLALLLVVLRRLPRTRAEAKNTRLNMPEASSLAGPLFAVHAWGPLLLMSSLSAVFGVDLEMHWGTAFLWVVPIWFLRTQHGQAISLLPLRVVFTSVVLLQIVMLLAYR